MSHCLLGIPRRVQQQAHGNVISIICDARLLHDPFGQHPVHIITTQRRITASGHHLEHSLVEAQNGDIESAATKVINSMNAICTPVQSICYSSRCGFVQQAKHIEPSQACSILGGLPLCIIKIGRYGDHHTRQPTTQSVFCPDRQRLEYLSRYFHCAKITCQGADPGNVGVLLHEPVGQFRTEGFNITNTATNQPLGGSYRVQWVSGGNLQRLITYQDVICLVMDD